MITKRIIMFFLILIMSLTISCLNKNTAEESEKTFQEWYQEGNALSKEGKYEEAVKCYEKSVELNPKYTMAWKDRGLALHELERYEEAIYCYDRVLEIEPEFGIIREKKEEAQKKMLEKISKKETSPESNKEDMTAEEKDLQDKESVKEEWSKDFNEFCMENKYEEALRLCNEILEKDPQNFDVWLNKLTVLIKLKKDDEADKCIQAMTELKNDDIYSWLVGVELLMLIQKNDSALIFCEKALEIDPQSLDALFDKGEIFCSQCKYEEAIACYDKILAIEPSFAIAGERKRLAEQALTSMNTSPSEKSSDNKTLAEEWTKKCETFFNTGNYEEAIKCCDKALEIDPECVIAFYDKGLCLTKTGKFEDAIKSFDDGLKVVDKSYTYDDEIYFRLKTLLLENKGMALMGLGKTEEGSACIKEAAEYRCSMGGTASCESNLKNIATALEMFSSDHGNYPQSLEEILKTGDGKGYMSGLPECPVSKKNYVYVKTGDGSYSLKCGGFHMKDHKKIVPAYNPSAGIKLEEE